MQLNEKEIVVVEKGFPVMALLWAAIVLLKLLGYINISWWWVFMPFWGPPAVFIIIMAIVAVVAGFAAAFEHLSNRS